jgi:TIR domain
MSSFSRKNVYGGEIGGQQWEQEIPIALQASDFILIFFSQNSIRKIGYVQNEFKLALEAWRQTPEGMIRTIPVRLDDSEVPRELAFPVKTRNFVRWSCPMLSMSRALSLTSASNGLMRCCLVRLSPPLSQNCRLYKFNGANRLCCFQ